MLRVLDNSQMFVTVLRRQLVLVLVMSSLIAMSECKPKDVTARFVRDVKAKLSNSKGQAFQLH